MFHVNTYDLAALSVKMLSESVKLTLDTKKRRTPVPVTDTIKHTAKQLLERPCPVELRILPDFVPHALARPTKIHDVSDFIQRRMSMRSVVFVVLMFPREIDVLNFDATDPEQKGYDACVEVLR